MTQDEQQQVNARMLFYERQCANLATEGANAAALAESIAIRLKAAEAKIAELTPKAAEDNVVPIKDVPA